MAKFSSKNVEFRDGQKAIFGSNDDSYLTWDSVGNQLLISTVVSGVDPTDPGHLITRRYLDDELSTVTSGSCVSALVGRTANFSLPTVFTDVLWDVTHVETDSTAIKHDDINTDNIVVYQNGVYLITYSISVDANSTVATFDTHVRVNDTSVIPGSLRTISEDDEINDVSNIFIAELEADDFVTIQIRSSASGDLLHTSSNFMVTKLGASQGEKGERGDDGLPGTGSTINILEGGILTASGVSHLNFEGNLDVMDNGSGHATVTISGSPGVDNLSLVQARRTTTYTLTTSYVDIEFDTTDEETFSTIIEHDSINTERINIKSDGTYLVLYDFSINASYSLADVTYTEARVLENNTTLVPGSWSRTTTFNDSSLDGNNLFHNHISNSCIVTLSANNYLTLQLRYVDDQASTATNGTFKVIKLEGVKGSGGDGSDISLLDLKDTPTTYSGSVGDYLRATSSGVEFDSITATGDHGGLTGLGDDDHTQYLLEDGSRELSSNWYYGQASISGSGSFYGNGATLSGVAYVDGDDVYFYDTTRSKDLGVAVIQIGCGRNSSNTTNQYLRTFNGTPMNQTGIAVPFNSTLVGMSMSGSRNNQTWIAQVRKNDSATVLDSLTITNSYENHTWAKDTNFSAGDRIQVYLSGVNINYPQVRLYFRRRK